MSQKVYIHFFERKHQEKAELNFQNLAQIRVFQL